VKLKFVNREAELRELDSAANRGGLLVLYGRRRVGKTRLLRRWLETRDGFYSQAIEAGADLQLQQVFADLRARLETNITPKTWPELLEILALQKRRLIHGHAATVFEDFCRARYPGAGRYWEGNLELDLVSPDPTDATRLLVAEVKWRRLSNAERKQVIRQLESNWSHCALRARHPNVRFEVLDASLLAA
jgi:AAA+ ATPase superfamily predicted ATPase